MTPRWLCRLAVLATVTVVALVPSATANAVGDGTAQLVGPLPITAAQAMSGAPSCTDWATGPYADLDLWRFRVSSGAFVSATVGFVDANGTAVIRTVDGIDGADAWIATTAGWSLAVGTAAVTGDPGSFELARACPAVAGSRQVAVGGFAPAVDRRAGTGARPAAAQGATTNPRALAAGTDIAATVTLGATLVLAGLLLLIVRRRPRGRHRMRVAP